MPSLDWFMKGLGIFGGIAADDDIDDPDAGCHQVSLDMGQDFRERLVGLSGNEIVKGVDDGGYGGDPPSSFLLLPVILYSFSML